ncbi:unnamed protein product [Ambrosiozyma monospora]|uniref:Unnamed protein product n=1 Tax=Ambrosiozyma monospora TaxID=43982 RepID=A0ACB5TDF2_AMBMO|nr:unnamed protein product [Ambrosiozyma monospora]
MINLSLVASLLTSFTALSYAGSTSLSDICTSDYIESILPADGEILGVQMVPGSTSASVVANASLSSGGMGGMSSSSSDDTTYTYCNVTVEYTHPGKDDSVILIFGFPDVSDFKDRFYVAGGGGFSLSTDYTSGLEYGAVSGATSAGYDAFDYSLDDIVLKVLDQEILWHV